MSKKHPKKRKMMTSPPNAGEHTRKYPTVKSVDSQNLVKKKPKSVKKPRQRKKHPKKIVAKNPKLSRTNMSISERLRAKEVSRDRDEFFRYLDTLSPDAPKTKVSRSTDGDPIVIRTSTSGGVYVVNSGGYMKMLFDEKFLQNLAYKINFNDEQVPGTDTGIVRKDLKKMFKLNDDQCKRLWLFIVQQTGKYYEDTLGRLLYIGD